MDIVKIDHIEFRKDCAKGMSLSQFKKTFSAPAFQSLDLDKAYITLGGKKITKKVDIKEK